ncbi:hypothetical protein Bbelb_208990 [Branchiostoma belcheri]|nr:hypothetical protein Bbelb_208990 [Branchiostoma belcheri]
MAPCDGANLHQDVLKGLRISGGDYAGAEIRPDLSPHTHMGPSGRRGGTSIPISAQNKTSNGLASGRRAMFGEELYPRGSSIVRALGEAAASHSPRPRYPGGITLHEWGVILCLGSRSNRGAAKSIRLTSIANTPRANRPYISVCDIGRWFYDRQFVIMPNDGIARSSPDFSTKAMRSRGEN